MRSPSELRRERKKAAENPWGDAKDELDLSSEASKLERSLNQCEEAKRRRSEGPHRRAKQLKLEQERANEAAIRKKARYCMSKEVTKQVELILGHSVAHSHPPQKVQQEARLIVARKGYPPEWLVQEWFGQDWARIVNPAANPEDPIEKKDNSIAASDNEHADVQHTTTSSPDSPIVEPQSMSSPHQAIFSIPSQGELSSTPPQTTAQGIVGSQKRACSLTTSSISSQSPKSPPAATYPILRLTLGSKQLGPPLDKERPTMKVFPEYQNMVVDCLQDGQHKSFLITPPTTALLSLCRLDNRGHILSWNPLPENVGSFSCYQVLHIQLSPGTISELQFSCKLSSWFRTKFQVVTAWLKYHRVSPSNPFFVLRCHKSRYQGSFSMNKTPTTLQVGTSQKISSPSMMTHL